MATYRGAAGKGTKVISGKTFKLWGWLTTLDKQRGTVVAKLRKQYKAVRVLGANAPYAVWVRGRR